MKFPLALLCGLPLAVCLAAPAMAEPSPEEVRYLSYLVSQRVNADSDTLLKLGHEACSGLDEGTSAPMEAVALLRGQTATDSGLTAAGASVIVGGASSFLCPGH